MMKDLAALIAAEGHWLTSRILAKLNEKAPTGMSFPTSDDLEKIIHTLSAAIIESCKRHQKFSDVPPGSALSPMTSAGICEAHNYPGQNIPLDRRLCVFKECRMVFLDLLGQDLTSDSKEKREFINSAFDTFETAFSSEWIRPDEKKLFENLHTEKQRLTAQLASFQSMFDTLPSPVFLLGPNQHIEQMNHAATLLIHEEMHSENAPPQTQDLAAEDDPRPYLPHVLPWLAEALTPTQKACGMRIQREIVRDGRHLAFKISATPLCAEDETFTGTLVVLNDITEFKNTERAAKRAEQRFWRIFNSSYDAIIIHTQTGQILDVNESMLEIFSTTRDKVMGLTVHDLSCPSNPKVLDLLWEKTINHAPQLFDWKAVRPGDGSSFDTEVFLRRIHFSDSDAIMATIRDVSDRKMNELALRQSEEYHRAFFENNHSIMLLIQPQTGDIYDANPAACKFYGYERADMRQMHISAINITPKDELARELKRARLQHRDHFHFRHKLASGEIREVEVYSGPITYRGQNLLFSIVHDSTEKNRIQMALQLSEEKFRRIFENMQDAYFLADLEGWPILVNNALPQLLDYSTDEFLRVNLNKIFANADEQKILYEDLQSNRQMRLKEVNLLKKNGQPLTAECNIQIVYDRNEPVAIEAICRDVTERKRANIILQNSESRYRELFESSPISLWEEDFSLVKEYIDDLTRNGVDDFAAYFNSNDEAVMQCAALVKLLAVNEATLQLINAQSKYELLPGLETFLTSDNMDSFRAQLIALAAGRHRFKFEASIQTIIGDIKFVSVHLNVAPGYNDSWGKVIVSIIDITERKRLEEELKRLATTDPLTGASNRRHFLECAENEIRRGRRYGLPLSFLMLDIDHFKNVNDTYGHASGDKVLKHFVNVCTELMRETDYFGRLGGEEFGALLIQSDEKDAHHVAERIRETLAATIVEDGGNAISFTVSIGLCCAPKSERDLADLMVCADRALYEAKNSGRNRVVCYTEKLSEIPD